MTVHICYKTHHPHALLFNRGIVDLTHQVHRQHRKLANLCAAMLSWVF